MMPKRAAITWQFDGELPHLVMFFIVLVLLIFRLFLIFILYCYVLLVTPTDKMWRACIDGDAILVVIVIIIITFATT